MLPKKESSEGSGEATEEYDSQNAVVLELKTPEDYNVGDFCLDKKVVFEGEVSESLANFTGKIEYVNPHVAEDKEEVFYEIPNGSNKEYRFKTWTRRIQKRNNDIEHLKYYDCLEAEVENLNLKNSLKPEITLERQLVIFKIVLDGFIYPIWGGTKVFLSGLSIEQKNNATINLEVTIGKGKNVEGGYEVDVNGLEEHPKGNPIARVSSHKDPITGYALRGQEDSEKITAYICYKGKPYVKQNSRLGVYLETMWSNDIYGWATKEYNSEKEFEPGKMYTLDFTKKINDEYEYTPKIAVSVGADYKFEIMNLGASKPEELGNYYIAGYDTPIKEGDDYPDKIIYYDSTQNVYNFGEETIYNINMTYDYATVDKLNLFLKPELIRTEHIETTRVRWGLPTTIDIVDVRNGIRNDHLTSIRRYPETGDVKGAILTNKRTKHCLYIPFSGKLKPSQEITSKTGEVPTGTKAIIEYETYSDENGNEKKYNRSYLMTSALKKDTGRILEWGVKEDLILEDDNYSSSSNIITYKGTELDRARQIRLGVCVSNVTIEN